MNTLLFKHAFKSVVDVKSFGENIILFDNGWSIEFFHRQSCCEVVWADCQNAAHITEFTTLEIKEVSGMGVLVNDQLVNCYNEQNGYYSDILEMKVFDNTGRLVFAVDNVPKEDRID